MLDQDISTEHATALLHQCEPIGSDGDPFGLDRRRFLQMVGMGVGAGVVGGGASSLLDQFIPGLDPSAWAAGPVGPTDGILVVIWLYGGNDGMNTVVPINDGIYYDQHGSLAISANQTLPLDGDVALNPALTEFKRFWDDDQLAIVDGIGYPNPDLSHFNSLAYWMSGRTSGIPTTGWIGRWLDGYLGSTKDLYAAAEVGYSVPLHMVGNQQRGTVVPANRPGYGSDTSTRSLRQYEVIRDMQTTNHGGLRNDVSQAFVDQLDLARTLEPVVPDELPESRFQAQLEVTARLINANLGFRVMTSSQGGYDTHAGQPTWHTGLLTDLNEGVRRFFEVLDPAWSSRVTVVTCSEFGRTSWDNDGAGSDHGTAAPQFVFGQNVRGGRYGQRPTLAGLKRWERMAHHVDYRSYYASLIEGWLGGGSADVLGGNYEDLGLFAQSPGSNLDGTPAPGPTILTPESMFTPVNPFRAADTRSGAGGVPRRAVGARKYVRVKIAGVGPIPASDVTAVVVNVMAVSPTSPTFLTVYPGATAQPRTSNLNAAPGRPIPNLAVVAVGQDGYIEVANANGSAHCIVDVFGYFSSEGGDRFSSTVPQRLFDSRKGTGIRAGKIRHAAPVDVQVAGRAGVPSSGATAVVMNLTATQTESPGYLRMAPTGQPSTTSNSNFFANNTVANLVICRLGAGGKVTLDSAGAGTHVIGDVFGYFGSEGARLRSVPAERFLDTREGTGSVSERIGPNRTATVVLGGRGRVPPNATAVVMNVTATSVDGPSFVAVWPTGQERGGTSNLNVQRGETLSNLVIAQLGDDGAVQIGNPVQECHVIADVMGYFID